MSDQTTNPEDLSQASDTETSTTSDKDIARMKRIGAWHATALAAAIGLWGAVNQWAMTSELLVAQLAALGIAIAAATVMASIIHEWGHFSGAKISGAIAPVSAKPVRLYFMFTFDMVQNSTNQFIAMSLGGILANWLLVVLLLILIPLQSLAAAMLIAVAIAKAVNVSFFEVPIVMQVRDGGDPSEVLERRLKDYGLRQLPGLIVGALAFLTFT